MEIITVMRKSYITLIPPLIRDSLVQTTIKMPQIPLSKARKTKYKARSGHHNNLYRTTGGIQVLLGGIQKWTCIESSQGCKQYIQK